MSKLPAIIFKFKTLFLLLMAVVFTLSCSNSYIDDIDRGTGYNYQPGFPELRVAATGHITEDNTPTIIVSGDIVYGSLVYTQSNEAFEANVLVEIIIQNETDTKQPLIRREFETKLSDNNSRIVNSQEVYRFEEIFEVSPGDYTVRAIITDQTSDKQLVHTLETSLPNPRDELSHITEIRILGKNNSVEDKKFHQATAYDIPSKLDSLKFIFQVTNNNLSDPLEIESRLLKFESDTSIARPMHYHDYSPSSITHIGINYNKYEEIQTSTRTLTQPGSVVIEFAFTDLSRGNYRLEVSSNTNSDNELYKARDFSIKSPNYPSLKTAKELARPLNYIMTAKEYEQLISIQNPDSLKIAIDRFWLSNIKNSITAKNVISLYYERVEEANKQFTNFKEGWKTDPGMIYILFGPPWYVYTFSDQMHWSYAYNREDPEKNFSFTRTKLNTKFFPFDNYLLIRSNQYFNIQYQQIERWRSGNILNQY